MSEINVQFVESFQKLSEQIYQTASEKGWWDDRLKLIEAAEQVSPELGNFAKSALRGMSIALKHSELSEALENIRHGYEPDDKIPEFTGEEAEYADTIIRIMDTAHAHNLRVAEAIIAKMAMNKTRSFKHGGKSC